MGYLMWLARAEASHNYSWARLLAAKLSRGADEEWPAFPRPSTPQFGSCPAVPADAFFDFSVDSSRLSPFLEDDSLIAACGWFR